MTSITLTAYSPDVTKVQSLTEVPALQYGLTILKRSGRINFTHENETSVSFIEGTVTYRTNQAYINKLEEFASKNQQKVVRSFQCEFGPARKSEQKIIGTVLVMTPLTSKL